MSKKYRVLFFIALAIAITVAGCGGKNDEGGSSPTPAATATAPFFVIPSTTTPTGTCEDCATVNTCSPDGYATAREGVEITSTKMTNIPNGTKVKILQTSEGYSYDFTKGQPGCGTTVRVQVEVLEGSFKGQVSWISGACVEGIAK